MGLSLTYCCCDPLFMEGPARNTCSSPDHNIGKSGVGPWLLAPASCRMLQVSSFGSYETESGEIRAVCPVSPAPTKLGFLGRRDSPDKYASSLWLEFTTLVIDPK